ncbi:hypothetical protein BCH308197_3591 [Bacillus cereus H3081.97]|uniref:Uncharacterized protein n=1 Tax=Bacillus cereus (strain AH187) TaxID=405534 RepID=B7I071_BACC7|nr:hypothetical protein BCAH187_A3649 [Bacillus cereus AH187]EDZ57009.1 hypothetical protein BCH308197_3591 [Bacillus cereus H3081.97]KLA06216.1 hypothetical protein B4153_3628 [Bacillus cereus]KZD68748.1 hypothetical protein B4116_0413 [Bacillus cereus]
MFIFIQRDNGIDNNKNLYFTHQEALAGNDNHYQLNLS